MSKIADKNLIPYVLVDPALLEDVNEWDVVFGDEKSYMIHKDTGEEHTFDTQYKPKWCVDQLRTAPIVKDISYVYILWYCYDEWEIYGIYDNEELAEMVMRQLKTGKLKEYHKYCSYWIEKRALRGQVK